MRLSAQQKSVARYIAVVGLTLGIASNGPRLMAEKSLDLPAKNDQPRDPTAQSSQLFPGLTGYTRKVTCGSAQAQTWFDQGIQLLYGFNQDEAIRSFEKAAEIDPSCAMAWWGSAYAHGLHINNPKMTEVQSRLAYEAAQKAMAALDTESHVERALVRAVSQRYRWPAPDDRSPIDKVYARAMEDVWHQFPDDVDVRTLYAESLMNLQPWDLWTSDGKPKGRTLEILAVLEGALDHDPSHPGANHLYIHAIEASPWPEKGLPAAERLGGLVPGAGHLVHMPSHIFIRVGRYTDAADANQKAIDVDEAYFAIAPKPDFYSLYFMHNIHFLAYSAMMEARYETAIAAARKIESTIPAEFLKNYVTLADGFMSTSLHVLIRFGKWQQILAEPEPEPWRLLSRAERHFARSVALANTGKTIEARREIQSLDDVADELTDDWKMGNNLASEVIKIARAMAVGELAYHEGNHDRAFTSLRTAVQLEENLAYDEPPGWMQPVRHALGALLLADGQLAEAEEVYRADLQRHPNNAWSLLGLRQALENQGRTEEVQAMARQVDHAWARADVPPVASCYCHPDAQSQPAIRLPAKSLGR